MYYTGIIKSISNSSFFKPVSESLTLLPFYSFPMSLPAKGVLDDNERRKARVQAVQVPSQAKM
jgi:hypothetical protein